MIIAFIDTNVYLDLILEREPYCNEADIIFRTCEQGEVAGYTSPISIANIAYGIKKHLGANKVRRFLKDILSFTEIIDTNRADILSAINSPFTDMEDAFQHYSALKIRGVDFIITRNISDFKHSLIPVISPRGFLHHLKNSST